MSENAEVKNLVLERIVLEALAQVIARADDGPEVLHWFDAVLDPRGRAMTRLASSVAPDMAVRVIKLAREIGPQLLAKAQQEAYRRHAGGNR